MTEALPARRAAFVAPARLTRAERFAALALAVGALVVLLVAAKLEPSPIGMGTHQQLGLPACTWPTAFGMPCPSCGMTTAFAHAARADLASSFLAQPFGAILAVVAAMVVVLGLFAAATASRVFSLFTPVVSRWGAVIGVTLLLLSWGYKILQFNGLVF